MSERKPIIPIAVSILVFIGWLIFILFFTLFWSTDFTFFQNIMITVISLIIVGLLIGLGWIVWGMRYGEPSV